MVCHLLHPRQLRGRGDAPDRPQEIRQALRPQWSANREGGHQLRRRDPQHHRLESSGRIRVN